MYGYKPQNGKWQLMIWDMNIVLGNSGSWAEGQNLFVTTGGGANMDKLYYGDNLTVMRGCIDSESVDLICAADEAAHILAPRNPFGMTIAKHDVAAINRPSAEPCD